MKHNKVIAAIISALLAVNMIGIASYAEDAEVLSSAQEVFNFTFEDGNPFPTFYYGHENYEPVILYEGDSYKNGTIEVVDNIYEDGIDEKSIKITDPSGNVKTESGFSRTWFKVPTLSETITNFTGGKMLIHFRLGTNVAGYAGGQFFLNTKDSTGKITARKIYFTLNGDGNIQFGTNGSDMFYGTEWKTNAWNDFSIELTYGSAQLKLYMNGKTVGEKTITNNDTFAGLGNNGNSFILGVNHYGWEENDVFAYIDDVALQIYNSGNYQIPVYEDFSKASTNSISGYYANTGEVTDFIPVSGIFGKSEEDISIKITGRDSATAGNKDIFLQKQGTFLKDFEYGGTVHLGLDVAFDGDIQGMTKYVQIISSDRGNPAFLYMDPMGLKILGGTYPVVWEIQKWYSLDLYIYPGNGTDIKNKLSIYVNGMPVVQDVEFDAVGSTPYSQFKDLYQIRIGQTEPVLERDCPMYFDNFTAEYIPAGIQAILPAIQISEKTTQNAIRLVDNDTILLNDSTLSAGEIADKLEICGANSINVVIDEKTIAASEMQADGCYLKINATGGGSYLLPIVSKVIRYREDFSGYSINDNTAYKFWNLARGQNPSYAAGKTMGMTGLGGKAETDQSFVYSCGDAALNTAVYNYSNFQSPDTIKNDLPINGKATLEFSFLSNDESAINTSVGFQMHYLDEQGAEKNTTIINALQFTADHKLTAFSNINGNEYSLVVGTWANNQWIKCAVEINTDACSADMYINGEKVLEDICLLDGVTVQEGMRITDIWRLKIDHMTSNQYAGSYIAVDDFAIYVGGYDAEEDVANVASTAYTVDNNYISVDCNKDTSVNSFLNNLNLGGNEYTLYDDETFSGTQNIDEFGEIFHGAYLVLQTAGGAIQYYKIVDANEKTAVNAMDIKRNGATAADIQPGTYSFAIQCEKYNNIPETVYAILASYDENDALTGVNITEKDLELGKFISENVNLEIAEGIATVKAMVWDKELSPLAETSKIGA